MQVSIEGMGGGSGSGVTKTNDATTLAALLGMAEGDLAYRIDTDDYYYYTGAAWSLVLEDVDNADIETFKAASSTGVISGGVLSVGSPNTTFTITSGTGVVVDNTVTPAVVTRVTWSAKTNVTATYVASGIVSFVAIDSAGNTFQQLAAFTNAQQRQYIVIGSLVHVNLSNLDAVNQLTGVAISPLNQLSDLSEGLGKFNVTGNVFSANGANLNINKSVGTVHARGANWANSTSNPNVVSLASLTALSFQYRFQGGTNGATGTSINPDIYDSAGVSTAVPSNKVTTQRIYSFVSNNVKIQPGQAVYNSIAEAKASIQNEVFVTEPSILTNGVLRGFLVIKQGSTALNSATSAFFYEAAKFNGQVGVGGQSVSSMQNAYDNSLDPEILTDATRLALTVRRGSGADTDNIIEGMNNASSVTFSVKGNGAVAASGAVTGSNLSGTNTGDASLAPIGATPNANGASLAGQALNLQPADGSFGGVVTTAAQTFAGAKTFVASILASVDGTPNIGATGATRFGSIHAKDTVVAGRYPVAAASYTAALLQSSQPRVYLYAGATYDFSVKTDGNGVQVYQDGSGNTFVNFNYATGYNWFKFGIAIDAAGAAAPVATSVFDVNSTTKGSIHAPVMTTAQKAAIASPATGLRVYDSNLKRPEYYDGTLWQSEASPNTAAAQTPADAATPTILGYRRQVLPISGSGGAVTLADLSVSGNLDGDELVLLGTSDTNTVTVVSATNTVINGNCTLASGNTLTLVLYTAKWYEKARS